MPVSEGGEYSTGDDRTSQQAAFYIYKCLRVANRVLATFLSPELDNLKKWRPSNTKNSSPK